MKSEYTGAYDLQAYGMFCEEIKACAEGRRGWVGITKYARLSGAKRQHLILVARAMGLEVSHGGSHGYTAYRPA